MPLIRTAMVHFKHCVFIRCAFKHTLHKTDIGQSGNKWLWFHMAARGNWKMWTLIPCTHAAQELKQWISCMTRYIQSIQMTHQWCGLVSSCLSFALKTFLCLIYISQSFQSKLWLEAVHCIMTKVPLHFVKPGFEGQSLSQCCGCSDRPWIPQNKLLFRWQPVLKE